LAQHPTVSAAGVVIAGVTTESFTPSKASAPSIMPLTQAVAAAMLVRTPVL